MSYTEFSVTYIHNKFWSVNSVKVPSQRVVLDKNGHTTEDLFKTEEQKYNFEIYWEEHMIGGEVCIPGEGNYCCVKGKFFHLEKVKAAGFIDDQESFYYTLIYDDGQNDGLTNNVHLCGTINLTGDKDLVRKNIVQTTPLISNVNNFRYLNGYIVENEDVNIIFPANEKIAKGTRSNTFSSYDFLTINKELKKLTLGEPNRDKLIIPFLYRTKPKYHWKWLLVKSLNRLKNKSLGIYDVSQDNQMRRILEVKFNTNELYVISTKENKVFNYAKSLNENKYIEEIDLSGLTDLVELAPTTLAPLYDTVESVPKFNLKGLCETIRSRFNGPQSLIPKMEEILIEVFFEGLGDLISSEVNLNDKRIFKNVTVAPIARDIAWFDYENKLTTVNPEWLTRLGSLIPNQKGFRNFIFYDDKTKGSDMVMITGTADISAQITSLGWDTNYHRDVFKKYVQMGGLELTRDADHHITGYALRGAGYRSRSSEFPNDSLAIFMFNNGELCTSKGVQLVLPIHTHKFVEDGNEESDELDFTRYDGGNDNVIMLLPDYERNTHVGSIKCPYNLQNVKNKFSLSFDSRDQANPLKGEPIIPFITTELFEVEEYSVTDALKRKDLLIEGKTNLSRDIREINPLIVIQNFLEGCYAIKYKTYHSRCDNHNYCDYFEYKSTNTNPYQLRSGFNIWPLAQANVIGNWVQYQVEITLPYSDELINYLEDKGSYHHDLMLMGKVINGEKQKGKHHPNPLIGKNGRVQRMDAQDLQKLGSRDIVAIGLNPTNNSYSTNPWFRSGLATSDDSDGLYDDFGGVSTFGLHEQPYQYQSQKGSKIISLTYDLLTRFLASDKRYGPHTKADANYVIPLRIYNDTSSNNNLRDKDGYPQLSTGFVVPYEGFNYLCYYRFHPRFDEFGFGFSNTYTAFAYKSKDYFVMVIPNTGALSHYSVPTYTYRETIDNLSRESNIAFLVNGSALQNPTPGDTEKLNGRIYGGWVFANNRRAAGGAQAEYMHKLMNTGVNIPDIFFEEFIRKEFKSNHTDNPTELKLEYQYYQNGGQGFTINTLDEELPSFMVKYLNPNSPLCNTLYSWKTSTSRNDTARLNEGKSKLSSAVNALKVNLSTQNTGFALEGTDGCMSVKLNIQEKSTWDFELFTTRPSLIKSKNTNAGKFEYYNEQDVDVLINTSNEINMYGKRLPQKSRYISETNVLDLKLRITPLEDSKQTQASTGYKVEMKTDAQDLIRDVIEIPKEQVKALQMSDFERETMFRTIDLKASERHSEAILLDLNRDKFKVRDSYEQSENTRNMARRVSTATVDIVAGTAKNFTSFIPLNFKANIEGMEQAAKGVINLSDAISEYGNAETNRKARYAIGIQEFSIKGELMRRQHESNRANEMERLGQMSSKIQYPQMNSGLIYKQFNKTEFLSDVYITQYYPSGELLRYIKEYYKEYGYEILVRDFVCIGIDSIRTHLRYLNIFKNEYTNQRIRALIEARAMNGIFVSDTELFG